MERYGLEDLKLIYRVLHRHLAQHTELLDSDFFTDLQRHLQQRASREGVDVSDHGAWDTWLDNAAVSCATRLERRKTL
ncbi:MAG: hypothetical protein HYS12_05140 [Planctomycetes bacterium]|nr:hypothetical protein [Planctomycetota bacterium]